MRALSYILVFASLWVLFVLVTNDRGEDDSPGYCHVEDWPGKGSFQPTPTLDMPALKPSSKDVPKVFFVPQSLPLFCGDLTSLELIPHRLRGRPPVRLRFATVRKLSGEKRKETLDALEQWLDRGGAVEVGAPSVHHFTMIPNFSAFMPSDKGDGARNSSILCYGLRKGEKLRLGMVYQLKERCFRSGHGCNLYLWPVPDRFFASRLPTPTLRKRYFQHKGECQEHMGMMFVPKDGGKTLSHWYRWSLYRGETNKRIRPYYSDGYLGVHVKPYCRGFDGRYKCDYGGEHQIIGYPPVLSSLWSKDWKLGQRLRLKVEAIGPLGIASTPQIIDFHFSAPHVFQYDRWRMDLQRTFGRGFRWLGLLLCLQAGILLFWCSAYRRKRAFRSQLGGVFEEGQA